jgi:hypothetical protein
MFLNKKFSYISTNEIKKFFLQCNKFLDTIIKKTIINKKRKKGGDGYA